MEKVNRAGAKAIGEMKQRENKTTWENLLDVSWIFSKECGLLTPEVERAVKKIQKKNEKAFMIMIGNSLVSTLPDEDCPNTWKTNIDLQGTRLL